jgi:adenosine tuberculosinyltransferase
MEPMERDKFLNLPVEEVANIVRAGGSKVCVFPFNGTRRWFLLEYGRDFEGDAAQNYVELTTHGYINIYKLVFEHGIDTIVAPVFGGEILNRGDEYMREIGANMSLLATHPAFLEFYESNDIRVHFYGDYRKKLSGTPYAYICDMFDEVTRKTAHHTRHRLFYGVWADESTETIAELSVKHFQENGKIPSSRVDRTILRRIHRESRYLYRIREIQRVRLSYARMGRRESCILQLRRHYICMKAISKYSLRLYFSHGRFKIPIISPCQQMPFETMRKFYEDKQGSHFWSW